jgi:hypothetical protein
MKEVLFIVDCFYRFYVTQRDRAYFIVSHRPWILPAWPCAHLKLEIAEADEHWMAEWRRLHPEDVAGEDAFWADLSDFPWTRAYRCSVRHPFLPAEMYS